VIVRYYVVAISIRYGFPPEAGKQYVDPIAAACSQLFDASRHSESKYIEGLRGLVKELLIAFIGIMRVTTGPFNVSVTLPELQAELGRAKKCHALTSTSAAILWAFAFPLRVTLCFYALWWTVSGITTAAPLDLTGGQLVKGGQLVNMRSGKSHKLIPQRVLHSSSHSSSTLGETAEVFNMCHITHENPFMQGPR